MPAVKNIYPGPIEDLFKTSPWIDQLVVVGEKKSFMAALIVPDFEALEKYAKQNDIKFESITKN
jgi:long-chain acyl-CoA synthetase